MQFTIRPFDVIDRTELPEVKVDQIPSSGDSLVIDSQVWFVCDIDDRGRDNSNIVKVIPGVIRYHSDAGSPGNYLESLSAAISRML
ncbi:MAG: hypothetical protein RBT38_07555 [Bacteroidales bacterium]|jgi:hypothetical protein|nr:hypothetical protein [Bacteroidales bacterium]